MLRKIFFVTVYGSSLILAFVHPIYGLVGYIFEWYNHPPLFWWGRQFPDLRYSLIIALVTLIAYVFRQDRLKKIKTEHFTVIYWLVALLILQFLVTQLTAVDYDHSMEQFIEFFKFTILYFLIAKIPRIPRHYKLIIWVFLLGAFDFGRIATQDGSNRNVVVEAPNAGDENAIAAHVLTAIPFLIFYFFNGKRWEKILAIISLPFIVNLIILANSRGAMVGLLAVVVVGFFLAKAKQRFQFIIGLILAIIMFIQLSPPEFVERQMTIKTYKQDSSAEGRLVAWSLAWQMMKDHPFGIGGGGFIVLNTIYKPEWKEDNQGRGHDVHNTFLLCGVEWGFLGLFLFLGFLIHTFMILFRIRRDAYRCRDPNPYLTESTALMLALIGILVAGFFINRLYGEIIYWLSALVIALRNIQYNEIQEMVEEEETVPANLEVPGIAQPVTR